MPKTLKTKKIEIEKGSSEILTLFFFLILSSQGGFDRETCNVPLTQVIKQTIKQIIIHFCIQNSFCQISNKVFTCTLLSFSYFPIFQCTFCDMFARETFTYWCDFADLPHLLTLLEENYARWKTQS